MNVGFLLFPDLEELDLIGPWEMIGMWGEYFQGPARRLLVGESDEPVACAKGLRIVPDCSFDDCPPLDVLLVPGGRGTRQQVTNQTLIRFVREQMSIFSAPRYFKTLRFNWKMGMLSKSKRRRMALNSAIYQV